MGRSENCRILQHPVGRQKVPIKALNSFWMTIFKKGVRPILYKFSMLLLASSDSKDLSFAWHWVCTNIGTCLHLSLCWWLQCHAITDRLQRVLNAAARVISRTHKFDRGLTHLLTPSSIGWMFLSASSLSMEWPFIGVCGAMLLSTSLTAAGLQLMRSVASVAAQQVAISSSCHDIVAPILAVGRSSLQARRPGTRCQTISVIRHIAKTLLGDY